MTERTEFVRCCALCGEVTKEGERALMTTASKRHGSITLEMHGTCLVDLLNRGHAAPVFDLGDIPLR